MRLNLFWKLGLSYLALLLVALLVVHLYTTSVLERHFVQEAFAELESLVRVAEAKPPSLVDEAKTKEWTAGLARSGARVTIIAANGQVIADSEEDPARMDNHASRPEVGAAFTTGRGRATRYSDTVERDLVYLAVRHDWNQGRPVVLRLALPLGRVRDAISEVRRPMASISIAVLLVGGLLSLVFSRAFSLRVRRLKEFSGRVSEGDFTPASVARGGDELSELASSLNETASRLSTTIRSLENERNQSAAILSSMSEGVAVVGSDERLLYSNQAFRDALGHTAAADELEGRALVEVTREPGVLRMVHDVLSLRERRESEATLAGREPRHFLVRAAPVDENGAVIVFLDITDIRRLERVRRDFIGNVSHELKTPLTAIQGFAETLLGGALDEPDNRQRFVEIIREHAIRLGRLTEDLPQLSRIEAGKLELELKPLPVAEIAEIVDRSVEMVAVKSREKKQTFSIQLPEDLPDVLADANALTDVLQNLLDNAVQYTPDGGHIELRAEATPQEVELSVWDDGIGIPAASRDRIFERFYRVDAARSRKVGGTGLGLSIAKHLVEAMHGRIRVDSTLGKGATFTVHLQKSGIPGVQYHGSLTLS